MILNYRNKSLRKAVEEFIKRLAKEGFGIVELKQTIKIIRTTFNQELLKVKK